MSTPTHLPPPETVSKRKLDLTCIVLVLGASTTLLDTTIVNLALDHLSKVFDSSVSQTQWVVTGYLLAYVSVIPLSGWVSERFGARNTWMFAVSVFLIGSILCGLAGSLPELIAFRILQGIGGGMVMPITMSILARAAGPERIGKAMMAVGLPSVLAPILGSVLGGVILESLSWHWLFFINVPICLAALVLGPIMLPANAGQRGQELDVIGFLFLTPGVIAIAYGIGEISGEDGFAAITAWLPLTAGVVLISAFVVHSLRARRPALIDVRVFGRRSFGLSSLITFMSRFSVYALMFVLSLFYQQVRGESVLATGLFVARKWVAGLDARIVVAGGVVLTMIGIVPFALADSEGGSILLSVGLIVQDFGAGAGMFPVMALALSGLGHAETPSGTAAFSVVQRVGAPFGVAIIAVIFTTLLGNGQGPSSALAAFSGTFWWIFGLSAIPFLLALFLPTQSTSNEAKLAPPELIDTSEK